MSVLKKNIVANSAGNVWQALVALAFVPLYIKFMGIEAYGLVGIFLSLHSVFSTLSVGLGMTINRELARLSVMQGNEQRMRNLARSMEVIYWCLAFMIGVVMMSISPLVAHHWIRGEQLSAETIERALVIIGLIVALEWPVGFYSGALAGVQKQVLLNGINIGVGTLRGVGAVLVLWKVSSAIDAFFMWHFIVSFINIFLLIFYMWKRLPVSTRKAVFQGRLIYGVWRYAAGVSGITVLATLLTQIDKVILSKVLTLEMFGYYTLASVVGMTLYKLITAVFSGVYPRLAQMVALANPEALRQFYHKACQFMSVLILPAGAVLVFFSYEVLLVWTGNPTTAEKSYVLVSILTMGTVLNGLMQLPYALQLAHGWTSLTLYVNLFSVAVLVPLTILMAKQYGAIGGALCWLFLNIGYLLMIIPLLHRRLLPKEKRWWYKEDVGVPFIIAFSSAGAGRFLLCADRMSPSTIILLLISIAVFAVSATAIVTPVTRSWASDQLAKVRSVCGS